MFLKFFPVQHSVQSVVGPMSQCQFTWLVPLWILMLPIVKLKLVDSPVQICICSKVLVAKAWQSLCYHLFLNKVKWHLVIFAVTFPLQDPPSKKTNTHDHCWEGWKHLPQSTTITTPILLNCYASALRLLEHCSQEVHHGSLANNQHQQPETDQQLENSSMGRLKFLQILQDWALLAHNWTMYNCLAAPAGLRQSAPGWFPWIRLMLPSASCGLQHVARFHWQKCSLLLQVPIEQQHAMSPLTFNSPGCIRPIVRSDSL